MNHLWSSTSPVATLPNIGVNVKLLLGEITTTSYNLLSISFTRAKEDHPEPNIINFGLFLMGFIGGCNIMSVKVINCQGKN